MKYCATISFKSKILKQSLLEGGVSIMRLRNYTDFTSLSRLQQDSQRLIPCLHNQIVIVSKRRCSHQTSCHKILLNLLSCLKVLQKAPRDVAFMNSHQCWHGLYGDMVALQSFLLLWVTFTYILVSNPSKLIKSPSWILISSIWYAGSLLSGESMKLFSLFFGNTTQGDTSHHKAVWASAQLSLILTSWCSEERVCGI